MHPLVLLLTFGAATKITKGLLCLLHSLSPKKNQKTKNLYRQVSYTKHLPGGCSSGQERRDEHGAPVGDFAAVALAAPGSSMCTDHPASPAQPQGFCPTWTPETLTRIFQVLFAQLPCLTLLQPFPLKHNFKYICHLVLHPLNIFLYSHLPGSLYHCGASRFSPPQQRDLGLSSLI